MRCFTASSAMASICSSSRSGAIFTASGLDACRVFAASVSRRAMIAARSSSSFSFDCRSRRFFVLGEEMFTAT